MPGTLPFNAPAADVLAARSCALEALASKRAFKLFEWTQIDDNWRTAKLYAYAGADAFVSMFEYRQMKPLANATTASNGFLDLSEARCKGLREDDASMCSFNPVCLVCNDLVESSWTCGAPPAPSSPCLAIGTYNRGKGMNPGQCCSPLREVSLMDVSYPAQDSAPTCRWPTGFAIFACVEGSCGDGRCEAPENVDCGCKLDCPDVFAPDADGGT